MSQATKPKQGKLLPSSESEILLKDRAHSPKRRKGQAVFDKSKEQQGSLYRKKPGVRLIRAAEGGAVVTGTGSGPQHREAGGNISKGFGGKK